MERIINREILSDIQETSTFEDLKIDKPFIKALTKTCSKEFAKGKTFVFFTDFFGLKVCEKSGFCSPDFDKSITDEMICEILTGGDYGRQNNTI